MSPLEILAGPSRTEVLQFLEKLGPEDFEVVKERVLEIEAQRKIKNSAEQEAHLLLKIQRQPPAEVWQEFDALVVRRKAEILTESEHKRLMECRARQPSRGTGPPTQSIGVGCHARTWNFSSRSCQNI